MTIFTQILYELATKHIVDKSTLLTIGPLTHPVYRQIKRLKDMELVKEIPCLIKSKKDRTQKTIDCLILTVEGIEYIKNKLYIDIPWAEYLSPANDAIILPDHYDKSRLALRFTRISTVGVIADIIGACESTIYFNENSSPEDASRPYLMSIVQNAIQAYQDAMNNPADEKPDESTANPIQFHSALKIKRLAAGINSSMSNDMRGDRYSGMLVSPQRSSIVYVLPSFHPRLNWSHRAVLRELRAYSVLRQNGLISATAVRSPCGILLVENEKALSYALNANEQAREKQKQSKDIRAFGEGLDHLWVAPITFEGNLEVHDLMVTDLAKENQNVIDLLTSRFDLEPNDEDDVDVFPVYSIFDEMKYAIGIHIDVNHIRTINRVIKRNGKAPARGFGDSVFRYSLCCRAWQIPYYHAMVDPKVKLKAIDDLL